LTLIDTKEDDMTELNDDRMLSARAVLERFNPQPTLRTLDRWLADPRIGFPRPVRMGNGRRYFVEREISDFIAAKARERVTFKA
jgi:predicted DNA-binding transcriptional regulator AlpA